MTQAYGIIYKAVSKHDGRVYIGATTKPLDVRKKQHVWAANAGEAGLFCAVLRDYGVDGFEWSVVAECVDAGHLQKTESQTIRDYESTYPDKGYNGRIGGYKAGVFGAEKQERITFDIHKSISGPIRKAAKRDGVSMADILRAMLRKSLEAEQNQAKP